LGRWRLIPRRKRPVAHWGRKKKVKKDPTKNPPAKFTQRAATWTGRRLKPWWFRGRQSRRFRRYF
jgi:hypothetical protein